MPRKRAILAKRKRTCRRDVTALGAGAAFWFVLAVAIGVGGADAWNGLPRLADVLTPHDLIAAEAGDTAIANNLSFTLHGAARPSQYAPQVLQPVAAHAMPQWIAQADSADVAQVTAVHHARIANVAIVVDDLGADAGATQRAIALPKEVTLSFLPYPAMSPGLSRVAAAVGHEVIVHVPMEPEGAQNPGPFALREGLSTNEVRARLTWAIGRVPDAVGINNHEGSRFTADRVALIPVVETLADRHFFFLDSRTTADTEVVTISRSFGVASAGRDVFLDDVQTPEAVAAQLAAAEARARENGVAIVIGHPHAATLAVLAAWTADAAKRGFHLVPASAAIRMKTENEIVNPPLTVAQAGR